MFVGKFYKFKEGTYADLGTPNKLLWTIDGAIYLYPQPILRRIT
jgi:hypothetical protein